MRFPLSSVFLPEEERTVQALSLDSEVEGSIVDFSDSGANPRVFALVEVVRKVIVVVPVSDLKPLDGEF